MIIDAHTHIGRKVISAGVETLISSMNTAGVDSSLVLACYLNDCPTPKLLADIAGHRDRLLPVGVASPFWPNAETLENLETHLRNKSLAAVKFYTGYEHFYPSDSSIRPYLELLAQHGIPAIFHTGDCYTKVGGAKLKYAHPLHIDDLAVEMPNLTIVMAHMGNPWTLDGAEVCYKNPNVYADCSGFVCDDFTPEGRASFIQQIRQFLRYTEQPEKLLFGSDWPIVDQTSYVKAALEALDGNSTTTELVMAGNAIRVFGLNKNI